MRDALDKEGLKPYLMIQTIGYHAPDGGSRGFIDLPELEFGGLNNLSCLFGCSSSHPPPPPPLAFYVGFNFPTGYIHPGEIIPCYSYMQVPQDRVGFSSYSILE